MAGVWFALAYVLVLVVAFSLARTSKRSDEEAERMFAEREFPVSRRLPLYDWADRGDFRG